ncbi:hypothetical protein K1T71_003617 [Dendrolimus kikuchii]|uniref:Uncharacterized protein n=1 Tax=Dendrolimus kikuchii TaxID=765133 RepID=A0ACC1D8H7_9NEOP|nr:hypothetical protein K1T71_003617 [Dendrolimus kikuchii]
MKERSRFIWASGGSTMPCESCAVQFSVFRRKRVCVECERYYCSGCLRRGGGAMCAPCRVLSTRPLTKQSITHLKVRDLQCFLQRQNVSTRGCVEKEELLNLCVLHVNSSSYRRRGPRGNNPFSTLKGFTNNINDFINSALDLRSTPQPAPPPPSRGCYNSSHTHAAAAPPNAGSCSPQQPRPERFTTTPGGERNIDVPIPEPSPERLSRDASCESERRDTDDCYEIEDLDDSTWEFVPYRPAEPLPNDSEVLLSATGNTPPREESEVNVRQESVEGGGLTEDASRETQEGSRRRNGERDRVRDWLFLETRLSTPQRAASELELPRTTGAGADADADADADATSLQDEPLMHHDPDTPRHISLEQFKQESELEGLNVKQIKELLARNRVEFRGCLERADLLARAKMLWRDHHNYANDVENLPLEECCKICMAAPLECVLLECGHIAACTACSKQLSECPICRQYVVRAVRFFRS